MEGKDHAHLFVFSGNNKAGMAGIDKDKQAQIIYDSSKNSEYFKRAEQQDKKTQKKVIEMKKKINDMSSAQITASKSYVNKRITELECKRSMDKLCCVLDMVRVNVYILS